MKIIKFLIFIGLFVATSCSNKEDLQPLEVTVNPAAKVINYQYSSNVYFAMPEVPKGYENLPELKQWQAKGVDCKVSGEKTMGFQNLGQNVFVTGKWTITGTYGNSSAVIWVLPGATLQFTGSGFEAGDGQITIYNYGTLAFNGNKQCRLGGHLAIYSQTTIDKIPNLNLACQFSTNGSIKVNRIHFNNSANVWLGCKLEALEEVIFDNESDFSVGYIKSPKITIKANPAIGIRDGGYIKTDMLSIENVQTSKIYSEGIAVLKAKSIRVNNAGNLKATFNNLNIFCDEWIYGENVEPTMEGLGLNASVNLNPNDVKVEFTNDECLPIRINSNENKPSLETIGTVNNNHNHPISATCIQFRDNKAYVSWHERGKGIHGCIEVIENTNEGIKLLAYAEDKNTDFNHILVDNNRLLVVGHNVDNAIVGEIPLTNGIFTQIINYVKLKGGDANCIIRNGDYLHVACYGGLHTLNTDLSSVNYVPTSGSAKHLTLMNGKVLGLNLTTHNKDISPAELKWFDNISWNNPKTIVSDLVISPVDGKNTIASDGESVYVCLGKEGVKKYIGNSCVAEIKEGPANGICIDDKYLYVAFGKGLYIYAKNDLTKPVLKYTHIGRNKDGKVASCNYVAVNGDLIYLAYGLDGYDVLRMKNGR